MALTVRHKIADGASPFTQGVRQTWDQILRFSDIQIFKHPNIFLAFLSLNLTQVSAHQVWLKATRFLHSASPHLRYQQSVFHPTSEIISQGSNFLEDFSAILSEMFKCEQAKGNYIFWGWYPLQMEWFRYWLSYIIFGGTNPASNSFLKDWFKCI